MASGNLGRVCGAGLAALGHTPLLFLLPGSVWGPRGAQSPHVPLISSQPFGAAPEDHRVP